MIPARAAATTFRLNGLLRLWAGGGAMARSADVGCSRVGTGRGFDVPLPWRGSSASSGSVSLGSGDASGGSVVGGGERRSRCDSSGGFTPLSGADSSGASMSGSSVQLGWANKCLQKAVVRLCDGKQRRSALAYFKSTCANDSCGGLGACAVERRNFMAVLAFLDVSHLFVWVYDSEECAVGEAWRLGAEGARCLGALCWQGRRGHVSLGVCWQALWNCPR